MDVATRHRAERQCNTEHDPEYEPALNYEPALYYEHDPDGVTVGVDCWLISWERQRLLGGEAAAVAGAAGVRVLPRSLGSPARALASTARLLTRAHGGVAVSESGEGSQVLL